MKKGFTLIELLVVVLIIGILAAIAVPQYQLAVDKTRVVPYVQHVQSLIKAEQLFKLSEGSYTNQFDLLDTDFTQMCKKLAGNCHNELRTCPGGFALHIPSNNCQSFNPSIELKYCQQTSDCASNVSSFHFAAYFAMQTGKISSCSYKTTRGKRLCAYLNKNFQ